MYGVWECVSRSSGGKRWQAEVNEEEPIKSPSIVVGELICIRWSRTPVTQEVQCRQPRIEVGWAAAGSLSA